MAFCMSHELFELIMNDNLIRSKQKNYVEDCSDMSLLHECVIKTCHSCMKVSIVFSDIIILVILS